MTYFRGVDVFESPQPPSSPKVSPHFRQLHVWPLFEPEEWEAHEALVGSDRVVSIVQVGGGTFLEPWCFVVFFCWFFVGQKKQQDYPNL